MPAANTPEGRSAHAARQSKHEQQKLKTHVRRQVWVPKTQVDNFAATVKRMQKRWTKEAALEGTG